MKVWMQWWGGYNYGHGEIDESEQFDSMKAAADEFWRRYEFGDFHRNSEGFFCPGVGRESEMRVYFSDPAEMRDPYPDRLITFGPRGGVRVERC
jgi:hypothetical protein